MDSNRDDAERCVELASVALAEGDVEKASRLVEKSKRMFPLPEVQNALAAKIARAQTNFSKSDKSEPSKAASPSSKSKSASSSAANGQRSSHASSSQPPPPPRPATPEMEAAVATVHRKRNGTHYEVLEVTREADDGVLKKAYRKLALRLHPDRNFAKGADEAFKRVSQAFDVLSDPQRRSHYDTFGSDDPAQPQRTNRTTTHANPFADLGASGHFVHVNGAFTPDEVFSFFFTGDPHMRAHFTQPGLRRRTHRRARSEHAARHDDDRANEPEPRDPEEQAPLLYELWDRVRPLLWLFFLFLILSWWSGDTQTPTYSLQRTGYHTVGRTTKNGVPFYVQAGKSLSRSDERQMWYSVDRSALAQLRGLCEQEDLQEQYLRQQSRSWMNGKATRKRFEEQLSLYRKPSCQQFHHLLTSIRRTG